MGRFAFVIVSWLLVAGGAAAAGTSFSAPYRLTLEWQSNRDARIGDINGDGRQDLVVSSRNDPGSDYTLQIFLQRTDGVLAPPLRVALPENMRGEYRIALADMDGDGRDEAVVGAPDAGLYVVDMAANGSFVVNRYAGAGVNCKYIAAGDIDRDGNPDIVCHNEQLTAAAHFGNGAGGFRSSYSFTTLSGWYVQLYDFKTLQLADVTGDGYDDLLVAAGHNQSFHVFANSRMGGFFPSVAYRNPGVIGSVGIHAADIDGDGLNEVLTTTPGNRPNATVNVFRRGVHGYLSLDRRVPVHHSPTEILAGPVGAAGDIGVVTAHYTFNALSVLGEDGEGLDRQFVYDLPGLGNHIDYGNQRKQYAIALGDLDGDGCSDLAAATWSGVIVLYGCEPFRSSLPVSDFDGDGVSDLLWRDPGAFEPHMWLWTRPGSCLRPCPYYVDLDLVAQAVGDFDGDGSSDVFWRSRTTGANELRLGAFYTMPLTGVTDLEWRVVGAGDFDGDDRADLLWRHHRTGANVIWRSADHATQQAVTRVTDLRWQVVGIGDFDGDGRSDILWRHAATGSNAIWRSGNWSTQQAVSGVTDMRWQVVGIGDFDGDGRSDIVWRHATTGRNAIWKSGNHLTQQAVNGVTDVDWQVVAVGDYNGDGSSDLMWRNMRTGNNVIWRGARYDSQQVVQRVDPELGWFLIR